MKLSPNIVEHAERVASSPATTLGGSVEAPKDRLESRLGSRMEHEAASAERRAEQLPRGGGCSVDGDGAGRGGTQRDAVVVPGGGLPAPGPAPGRHRIWQ